MAPAPRTSPWDRVSAFSMENLIVAVVAGVLAAAIAGAFVLGRSASYESAATLLIDQPTLIVANGNPGPIAKLNQLRSKYAALVDTQEIAGPAGRRVGLSQGQAAARAELVIPDESLVLRARARGPSPGDARNLAQAVGEQLVLYVQGEQERAGIEAERRIQIVLVDDAGAGAKVSPTLRHAFTVAVLAGGAALLAVYLALQLLVARRRT